MFNELKEWKKIIYQKPSALCDKRHIGKKKRQLKRHKKGKAK